MFNNNRSISPVDNPITESVYNENNFYFLIAPIGEAFILTEDLLHNISTENDVPLITE